MARARDGGNEGDNGEGLSLFLGRQLLVTNSVSPTLATSANQNWVNA
jgi:hypothetical protein